MNQWTRVRRLLPSLESFRSLNDGLRFWLNCRAISQKEARREHPSGYAEVDELLKSHGACG